MTTVWVAPSATQFSCLCEPCLETARTTGVLFAEALMIATVRGAIAAETDVAAAHCAAGHEIVVRRNARPPSLHHRDERQLSIA